MDSSLSNSHASVRPRARASRRKSSVFDTDSPRGAIAGRFSARYRWPQAGDRSRCSIWLVAGQHVVGVERGVGDEQVVHDGEQVVAEQPFADPALVRHRHHRIAAVHDQRSDRRRAGPRSQRSLPRSRMFRTRTPGLCTSGLSHAVHVQRREVERVRRARQAAAAMLPRAAQHRQAGQRAELHRAVAMVLDADERPQQGRLRRRVFAGESLDLVRPAARPWPIRRPVRIAARARRAPRTRPRAATRTRGPPDRRGS